MPDTLYGRTAAGADIVLEQDASGNLLFGPGSFTAGDAGANGTAGASAYQVAQSRGFVGSNVDWLNSLKGPTGANGTDGRSPYQEALLDGYVGTEPAWYAQLNGTNGSNGSPGASTYEIAVQEGFAGDQAAYTASQVGLAGAPAASAARVYPATRVFSRGVKNSVQTGFSLNTPVRAIYTAEQFSGSTILATGTGVITPTQSGTYLCGFNAINQATADYGAEFDLRKNSTNGTNGTRVGRGGIEGTTVMFDGHNFGGLAYFNGTTDTLSLWCIARTLGNAINTTTIGYGHMFAVRLFAN